MQETSDERTARILNEENKSTKDIQQILDNAYNFKKAKNFSEAYNIWSNFNYYDYKNATNEQKAEALFYIGYCNDLGKPLEQDDSRAFNYYIKSSLLGDKDAFEQLVRKLEPPFWGNAKKMLNCIFDEFEKIKQLNLTNIDNIFDIKNPKDPSETLFDCLKTLYAKHKTSLAHLEKLSVNNSPTNLKSSYSSLSYNNHLSPKSSDEKSPTNNWTNKHPQHKNVNTASPEQSEVSWADKEYQKNCCIIL